MNKNEIIIYCLNQFRITDTYCSIMLVWGSPATAPGIVTCIKHGFGLVFCNKMKYLNYYTAKVGC